MARDGHAMEDGFAVAPALLPRQDTARAHHFFGVAEFFDSICRLPRGAGVVMKR